MEATRVRFQSIVEWALAAVFIVGILWAGSFLVREVRTVTAVAPVIAREPVPGPLPDGIPAGATRLPVLLLSDGKQVRLGDSLAVIAARLGRQAEGAQLVERSPEGDRLIRFYEHAGSRFVLVFEPRQTEHEVTAIYRQ
jgi:hypothetical protein